MTFSPKLLKSIFAITIFLSLSYCSSDSMNPGGDVNNLNKGAVGSSANDLLSAANYTALQVEIQYASGFAPPQTSIDYLRDFLTNRLNKPGGITITITEVDAPGQASYSLTELKSMEDEMRTQFTGGNTLAVYFFFVDGAYSENENVLGIAHRNTSMVLFQKRIDELSGEVGQVSTQRLTSTVLTHEFSHILGLVNLGSDMQTNHEDAANERHCNNRDCLMYYAVESAGNVDDLFGRNNPPTLDSNCLEDLRANGGK